MVDDLTPVARLTVGASAWSRMPGLPPSCSAISLVIFAVAVAICSRAHQVAKDSRPACYAGPRRRSSRGDPEHLAPRASSWVPGAIIHGWSSPGVERVAPLGAASVAPTVATGVKTRNTPRSGAPSGPSSTQKNVVAGPAAQQMTVSSWSPLVHSGSAPSRSRTPLRSVIAATRPPPNKLTCIPQMESTVWTPAANMAFTLINHKRYGSHSPPAAGRN